MFLVLTALASDAAAQNWTPGSGKIEKIAVEIQQTPQYQPGNVKDKKIPRPRDWVEVEIEFELSDKIQKEDFVPSVMLRYYIAMKGESQSYMMTGDVTHVNVPTGESIFSIVYLPPAVIDLAKGRDSGVSTSDILAVGVAVFVNGVEIARGAQGQALGWWLTPGSLVSQAGILGKSKTPFSMLWIDRHADEQTN